MFFSKLKAMSIGTVWALRREELSSCCSVCGAPWCQSSLAETTVIAVLANPITDEAQQKLLANCLNAAGWYATTTYFFGHSSCSSNNQTALTTIQTQLATHTPKRVIVFGKDAEQFLPSTMVSDQNIRLLVTHHPQEMLANPALKAQVWADFCSIME